MENSIKSGIKWFAMLAFVLMVCPGHHTAGGSVEAFLFDSSFDDVYEVFVVKHDWHTAIVLKTKDVSSADLARNRPLPPVQLCGSGLGR